MTTREGDGEVLLVERRDAVAVLTLNRPQVRNARNAALRRALVEACAELDPEPGIRAVVLTGAGDKAFCSGLDLTELAGDRNNKGPRDKIVGAFNDIQAVSAMRTPTIAAINGVAAGGGLELALACDLHIASTTARFGLLEGKRGNIPGNGGTQRLPRLTSTAFALEMLLTADLVDARLALANGLVEHVHQPDDLMPAALAMATKIAANAPLAVQAAKRAVYDGSRMSLRDGLALEEELSIQLRATDDWREGLQAFAEKRPPVWRSR
ncbi:MAG: enoyl-CoA hydratase/isomerase family protein [Streptosporangiaceae bacterium]